MKALVVAPDGVVGSPATRHLVVLKVLLGCGIISSLLHIATDILAATRLEGYSYLHSMVSELGAIGSPTRPLLNASGIVYNAFLIAFAVGVWMVAIRCRMGRRSPITGKMQRGVSARYSSACYRQAGIPPGQ